MWKSMSQLSANIEKLGPVHAILREEIHFEILSLKILRKLLRSNPLQISGFISTEYQYSCARNIVRPNIVTFSK